MFQNSLPSFFALSFDDFSPDHLSIDAAIESLLTSRESCPLFYELLLGNTLKSMLVDETALRTFPLALYEVSRAAWL